MRYFNISYLYILGNTTTRCQILQVKLEGYPGVRQCIELFKLSNPDYHNWVDLVSINEVSEEDYHAFTIGVKTVNIQT